MNPLLSALLQAGLVDATDAKRIDRQLNSTVARTDAEAEMLQAFQVGLSGQRDRLIDAVRASDGLLSTTAQNKLWTAENDLLWRSVRGSILDLASERATVATIHAGGVDIWSQVNDAVVDYSRNYYTSTAAENVGSIPNLNVTSRQRVGPIIAEWQQGVLPVSGMDGLPELIRNLQPVFGASRAQTIGVTETSRIFADSERQAALANPFIVHLLWQTGQDELVCSICGPLANTVVGKEEDGFQIADGFGFPPAHVNCRCGLTQLTQPALDALREQGMVSEETQAEGASATPQQVVAEPTTAPIPVAPQLSDWPKFASVDEAQAWAEENFAAWRDAMGGDFQEEDILGAFKGGRSGIVNSQLRGYEIEGANPRLATQMTKYLDQSFARPEATINQDVTTWRGMRSDLIDELRAGRPLESVQGLVITDKGFAATSLSQDVAEKGYGVHGVVAEIRVPSGSKAIYLDMPGFHNYDYKEYEMLLPRETQFRILSAAQDGDKTRLVLEVIQ